MQPKGHVLPSFLYLSFKTTGPIQAVCVYVGFCYSKTIKQKTNKERDFWVKTARACSCLLLWQSCRLCWGESCCGKKQPHSSHQFQKESDQALKAKVPCTNNTEKNKKSTFHNCFWIFQHHISTLVPENDPRIEILALVASKRITKQQRFTESTFLLDILISLSNNLCW